MEAFTQAVVALIKRIPRGKIATYGQIATLAGNPRAARQVARIIHALSEKEKLPWHRVVNREGRIALSPGRGCELQRSLLEAEGVHFTADNRIELENYQWTPG